METTFSVVIPTLDRFDDLKNCVISIDEQSRRPEEVIVVDDGDLSEKKSNILYDILSDEIKFKITESDGPPGLSTARNTGATVATSTICVIIDDDVVLGESYIARLETVYNSIDDPKLAGVGGFDTNLRSPSKLENLFNRIFYLNGDGWSISSTGIQSWDSTIDKPVRSDWLSGNNASYWTDVLEDHPFRHWNGGRETLEDVAMGWELKRNDYFCVVDPKLELTHADTEMNDDPLDFGIKRACNRLRIFYEFGDQSDTPKAAWAFIGDILRHVIAPAADRRVKYHWLVAAGMAIGFLKQVFSR
ncbi:glycosyltransferase family 2 protein [Halococcus thailandensis]|uniref:glycosyltransferase family 2 protein n=1 Tax=Halococcus thailandensis TaxID=335952 RepID=UPI0009B5CC19|nr:glycosyltransferase [Halococcus thailandensis]